MITLQDKKADFALQKQVITFAVISMLAFKHELDDFLYIKGKTTYQNNIFMKDIFITFSFCTGF